jgi:cobalt transporter subunit CbtA
MSGLVTRMFLAAILAGAVGGVLMTAMQQVAVFPMIFEAETYEVAGDEAAAGGAVAEETEAWGPADGLERTVYSGLANVITAVGFALLLVVGFALRGGVDWRRGALWGLAGFAAVNLAPALGLPPELPGAAAAELGGRQAWWLSTVVLTAGGLALIAFAGRLSLKAAGAVLLVVPHLLGAPQPEAHGGLAPAELEQAFIYASLVTNAVYWLVLGALAGYFFDRFGREREIEGAETA